MSDDYKYWTALENLGAFNRGLQKVSRDYYLDLIERYAPKTFLDLGCGFGDTYDLFRRNGVEIKYTGHDITPQFIEACWERYPGVEFLITLIENIPAPDNSFDMVTCRAVLEHLPDPEPAIREMARVSSNTIVIVWFRTPTEIDRRTYKKDGYWLNDYRREDLLELATSLDFPPVEEFTEDRHTVWVCETE